MTFSDQLANAVTTGALDDDSMFALFMEANLARIAALDAKIESTPEHLRFGRMYTALKARRKSVALDIKKALKKQHVSRFVSDIGRAEIVKRERPTKYEVDLWKHQSPAMRRVARRMMSDVGVDIIIGQTVDAHA